MPATIAPSERIVEKALEESKSGGAGWSAFSEWVNKHKVSEETVEERVHEAQGGGNFIETVIITKAAESLGIEGSPDNPEEIIDFAVEAVEQVTKEHGVPKESALTIVADVGRGIIAAPEETREKVVEMIQEGELGGTELIVSLSEMLINKGQDMERIGREDVSSSELQLDPPTEETVRNLGNGAIGSSGSSSFRFRGFLKKSRFAFSKS